VKKHKKLNIFLGVGCALVVLKFTESYIVTRLDQKLSMSGVHLQERLVELDLKLMRDMPRKHNCKQFVSWGIYRYQTCFSGSYYGQDELAKLSTGNEAITQLFSYRYTPPRPFLSLSRLVDNTSYFHGGRPFQRSYGRIFANGTWDVRVREKYLNSYSGVNKNDYPPSSAGSKWRIVKTGEWK